MGKALSELISEGIEIFIANVAIGYAYYPILTASRESYKENYNANVLGIISLTKIPGVVDTAILDKLLEAVYLRKNNFSIRKC